MLASIKHRHPAVRHLDARALGQILDNGKGGFRAVLFMVVSHANRCGCEIRQMDARRSFCLSPKQDDFELTQIGQPDPVEIGNSRVANDNVPARAALSARCGSFLLQLIAKPFAKESDRRN